METHNNNLDCWESSWIKDKNKDETQPNYDDWNPVFEQAITPASLFLSVVQVYQNIVHGNINILYDQLPYTFCFKGVNNRFWYHLMGSPQNTLEDKMKKNAVIFISSSNFWGLSNIADP